MKSSSLSKRDVGFGQHGTSAVDGFYGSGGIGRG